MNLKKFLFSKIFLIQLTIASILIMVMVWLTLRILDVYTNHGEGYNVPDFYGMSIEKTKKIIEEQKLQWVVTDSMFRENMSPGCILDQYPKGGFKVKSNRKIFLTINSKYPEKVRFPKLINCSFRQAIVILETNGFEIGNIEYIESDFRNLVLIQKYKGESIATDSLIVKGATIDLVLGKGKGNTKVSVPNLIKLNLRDAKEKVILSNLNLGEMCYDDSVYDREDSIKAVIYQQNPNFKKDEKLELGNKIDVWLTCDSVKIANVDPYGKKLKVPNFYGMELEEAKKIIQEKGLQCTVLDSIFSENMSHGYILEQYPKAGFTVRSNHKVFFTVSSKYPQKIPFPELTNLSFLQAMTVLETNGFKIGNLEYVESDFRNLVLAQKYKGNSIVTNDLVVKGATIDLILGKGKGNAQVSIPNLVRLDIVDAKEKIVLSNLNLGEVYYDKSVYDRDDSIRAVVWAQSPSLEEDIKLELGNKVHIWLTCDSTKLAKIFLGD